MLRDPFPRCSWSASLHLCTNPARLQGQGPHDDRTLCRATLGRLHCGYDDPGQLEASQKPSPAPPPSLLPHPWPTMPSASAILHKNSEASSGLHFRVSGPPASWGLQVCPCPLPCPGGNELGKGGTLAPRNWLIYTAAPRVASWTAGRLGAGSLVRGHTPPPAPGLCVATSCCQLDTGPRRQGWTC